MPATSSSFMFSAMHIWCEHVVVGYIFNHFTVYTVRVCSATFLFHSMEQLDCCNYGLLRSLYLYICVGTVHCLS